MLNVKAGDTVIYCSGGIIIRKQITTVTKVTPTGRIRVECSDSQFDSNGYEMGKHDIWSGRARITEATEEEVINIIQSEVVKECFRKIRDLKTLTYKQAVKILEIIKEDSNNG